MQKRILITILFIFLVASFFWTQSRYPALNEKADGSALVEDSLSFEALISIDASDPVYQRILQSTINWSYANKEGMAFGLLLGTALLTLLKLFHRHRGGNPFIDACKGMLMGAPLGVCVNCAAPIAKGAYKAGSSMATSLAAMLSSPALNIIVLTMLFSLFPFYMAIVKVALTLFLILVVLPLLSRYVFKPQNVPKGLQSDTCPQCKQEEPPNESWVEAFKATGKDLAKNFAYLTRTVVPLMILAGFLGVVLVTFLPVENLMDLKTNAMTMLIVAFIGTFLPIPMAFDVIAVHALMQAGVAPAFSMILLLTLGSYSIYSLFIVAQTISKRVALALFVTVVLLGMGGGYLVQAYDGYRTGKIVKFFDENFNASIWESVGGSYKDADAQAVAKKFCNELPTDTEGQLCFTEFIKRNALRTGHKDSCDQLQNEADRKSCVGSAIVVEARDNLDTEVCAQLQDDGDKKNCVRQVIFDIAWEARDQELCNQLQNTVDREICKKDALINDAQKSRDKEICNQIDERTYRRICVAETVTFEARKSNNMGLCNQLGDAADRKNCITEVVIHEAVATMNQGLCTRLEDEVRGKSCINEVVIHKAVVAMNQELCSKLQDEEVKRSCALNAVIAKIQFEIAQNKIKVIVPRLKQLENIDTYITASYITEKNPPTVKEELVYEKENISIVKIQLNNRRANNKTLFTKFEGAEWGMARYNKFTSLESAAPFAFGRGIASGDFNNDGWQDVVLATNSGIVLYKNTGGQFAAQDVSALGISTLDIFIVAFIDINNDGWQDIFFTTLGGEDYFALNDRGSFGKEGDLIKTPNKDGFLTISASFWDLNEDAYLDFILGNGGGALSIRTHAATNRLYINYNLNFEQIHLSEQSGDSLSTLFSDFTGDDIVDLVVGNDFEAPDMYYVGNTKGKFTPLYRSNSIISITPRNTMSVDTADLNNDLYLDIFSTDMNFGPGEVERRYCDAIDSDKEKAACEQNMEARKIIRRKNIEECPSLGDEKAKNNCMIAIIRNVAVTYKKGELCEKIPVSYENQRKYCLYFSEKPASLHLKDSQRFTAEQEVEYIRQTERNVLLVASQDGTFKEQAPGFGVDKSFWSWNAKFADLDNDEWQDIYVGNGLNNGLTFDTIHSNIFYHNNEGRNFSIQQKEYGLEDFLDTPSYTYIDIDNDGDLDIVATGINAPLRVYVNNEYRNNSITFEFRDDKGNHFGIGNKVYIYYADINERHQVREIKSGGGFLSFDAPIAHFGLGKYEKINRIQVVWSTGEKTTIDKEFLANQKYIISRNP